MRVRLGHREPSRLTPFRGSRAESPQVSLHGGPEGFDFRTWQKLARLDDAMLFTKAEVRSVAGRTDASAAVFALTSPDGDQGYSGTLYLETLVVLLPPVKMDPSTVSQHELGSIVIVYRAKLVDVPQGQKKVTPINLTQVCAMASSKRAHIFTLVSIGVSTSMRACKMVKKCTRS